VRCCLLARKRNVVRVLIELAQCLSHMNSIYLDLAPILMKRSNNLENGGKYGRIGD